MKMLPRILVYKFLCGHVCISLGYISIGGIAESYGNCLTEELPDFFP